MDLGLRNKVVVITGASRGIGKGIAAGFAAEGSKLVICARDEKVLKQTAGELRGSGAEVLELALDITVPGSAEKLVDAAVQKFGTIDVLVNSAGGNRRGLFADTKDEDWQENMELNFMAHTLVSRAVIPAMKKQQSGSIIFITSIFGRESGGPTLSIYNSTKSAMISLSKVMAAELAGDGIRVNNVAPGSIRFPGGSWDKRVIQDPEGMKEFIKRELPIGRFGTVEEVANVVTFLASERASLVTGASINVDGGQTRSII